jgi:hypothetical protein
VEYLGDGVDNFIPKWIGNRLTRTSSISNIGQNVGINAFNADSLFEVRGLEYNQNSTAIKTFPAFIANVDGTYYWKSINNDSGTTWVSMSITNSGHFIVANLNATLGVEHLGHLNEIYGIRTQFGLNSSMSYVSGTVGNAYGLHVTPFCNNANRIDTSYGIFINSDQTGSSGLIFQVILESPVAALARIQHEPLPAFI